MNRPKSNITHRNRNVKLTLTGQFDAQQTIEQMNELMHPPGYHERIILDFSEASGIKPVELYRLFAGLATVPHFNHIEICIEALQFCYMGSKTLTSTGSKAEMEQRQGSQPRDGICL